MKILFKKICYKIHRYLYKYHELKAYKYQLKILGATRYLQSKELSKEEKNYFKNDLNALYGLCVYTNTDSVKTGNK